MSRRTLTTTSPLGLALRERRGRRGLAEVAAELGITHGALSRIERGESRPALDTAAALAQWLGWTLENVVAAAGPPKETS